MRLRDPSKLISHQRLLELVKYDPETGDFTCIKQTTRGANHHFVGKKLGSLHSSGYVSFCLNGQPYHAHRLAIFYMTGKWPEVVDHINRCKTDNKFSNLRDGTQALNCLNTIQPVGKTGLYGATKQPHTKKFRSAISVNNKRHHIGYFDTAEQAHEAAVAEAIRIRGDRCPYWRGE